MAAQSVAPNRSRNTPQVDTDDVILARALAFSHWAKENIRVVIGSAVVLLLVTGGVIWWRYQQAQTLERAASEFLVLQQSLAAGNPELAIQDLTRFVGAFGGTPYGEEARVALGQIYLSENQPAEAVRVLQPLADEIGDSAVGPQGALLLAAAQQAAGETEAAVATYLQVADEAELRYLRAEALESAALIRSLAGDHAGAAELYARLVELAEEGTLDRSVYEMRLAEARASAASPN